MTAIQPLTRAVDIHVEDPEGITEAEREMLEQGIGPEARDMSLSFLVALRTGWIYGFLYIAAIVFGLIVGEVLHQIRSVPDPVPVTTPMSPYVADEIGPRR